MTSNENINTRIKLVSFFIFITLFALILRMYYLQIIRYDELSKKAKAKYETKIVKKGERGKIYDFNGNLLVGNKPCKNIIADPQLVGSADKCIDIAAYFAKKIPNLDKDKIFKRLSQKHRITDSGEKKLNKYAQIAKLIDIDLAAEIKSEIKKLGFKGIAFTNSKKRDYIKGKLLANILGFTTVKKGKSIGLGGLEYREKELESKANITLKVERARTGIILDENSSSASDDIISVLDYLIDDINGVKGQRKVTKKEKSIDGSNIYLTVIEPVQAIMEDELDKLMEKWKPKSAYGIMVNPKTGNVLAIAQRPTFNPNDRTTMKADNLKLRFAQDIFDPGSTMKPISISGALDKGFVKPDTKFYCEKGYWIYNKRSLKDAGHSYEYLTVSEIIQKSSNIGTAKIAIKMGANNLYKILNKFGFGKMTGLQLAGETRGILRKVKKWDSLSITRLPMGQGISVTALQLARAYCALGNGGKLVKLRIIDRIENKEKGIIEKTEIKPSASVWQNKTTHKKIIDMMKLVTQEGGTAKKAAIDGYFVAGKTGTSQKLEPKQIVIDENGNEQIIKAHYSHSKYIATFAGFVPADNPKFILIVIADEPKGSHYGGTVAAPAFKNIATKTLRYFNIPKDF